MRVVISYETLHRLISTYRAADLEALPRASLISTKSQPSDYNITSPDSTPNHPRDTSARYQDQGLADGYNEEEGIGGDRDGEPSSSPHTPISTLATAASRQYHSGSASALDSVEQVHQSRPTTPNNANYDPLKPISRDR